MIQYIGLDSVHNYTLSIPVIQYVCINLIQNHIQYVCDSVYDIRHMVKNHLDNDRKPTWATFFN